MRPRPEVRRALDEEMEEYRRREAELRATQEEALRLLAEDAKRAREAAEREQPEDDGAELPGWSDIAEFDSDDEPETDVTATSPASPFLYRWRDLAEPTHLDVEPGVGGLLSYGESPGSRTRRLLRERERTSALRNAATWAKNVAVAILAVSAFALAVGFAIGTLVGGIVLAYRLFT